MVRNSRFDGSLKCNRLIFSGSQLLKGFKGRYYTYIQQSTQPLCCAVLLFGINRFSLTTARYDSDGGATVKTEVGRSKQHKHTHKHWRETGLKMEMQFCGGAEPLSSCVVECTVRCRYPSIPITDFLPRCRVNARLLFSRLFHMRSLMRTDSLPPSDAYSYIKHACRLVNNERLFVPSLSTANHFLTQLYASSRNCTTILYNYTLRQCIYSLLLDLWHLCFVLFI